MLIIMRKPVNTVISMSTAMSIPMTMETTVPAAAMTMVPDMSTIIMQYYSACERHCSMYRRNLAAF